MDGYERLIEFFATAPLPPDPVGLYPGFEALRDELLAARDGSGELALEEALLSLYCHVHGNEAPYTEEERRRVDETGGYWAHAGGLSPILRAGPWLTPESVSMDLGAGNGLQGLLLQLLHPHRKTIQVEISSRMVEAGRALAPWVGIPDDRLEWRVADVMDTSVRGVDFLYLYRPVRPAGPGLSFYERLARELLLSRRPVTVFSVADCLRDFLPEGAARIESDGHLTVLRLE